MSSLHVMKMQSEKGFMRLEACDITLEKGVVHVCGKNRHGKSSLLKMIAAMKGKRYLTENALHDDNAKGDFTLSLASDDKIELIVKYSFTKKGSYLSVEAADGSKLGNPQDVLNEIISPLMDPWEFVALCKGTPANRRKAYDLASELMTYDFDAQAYVEELGLEDEDHIKALVSQWGNDPMGFLKAIEESITELRKDWKKAAAKSEGNVAALKQAVPPEKRNLKPMDIQELLATRDAEQNKQVAVRMLLDKAESDLAHIADLKAKIEELTQAVADSQEKANKIHAMDEEEFHAITDQINNAAEINKLAAKAESLEQAQADLNTQQEQIRDFDEVIEDIRDRKQTVLSTATGIEGLSLSDGNIFLHGQPMDGNASDEECLSFAIDVAMAKSDNSEDAEGWRLKTLICQNASLLDEDAMALIEKKSEECGFQVILEEVTSEKRPGVIFVADGVAENIKE